MSTVKIIKMNLLHFKGIKNLTIDFDANTNIYGDNGTGKTSIFDAFTWLLFGKDSTDRKDFQIKTLDLHNNVIPKIDHEVSANLGIDGDVITVKRVFREKWVKQKGALEAEFSGNETLYYWNEVPLSQKEFGNKVSEILDENVFKLITSPTAFNALKWQDRRNVLIKVAGEISDADLAKGNPDYLSLLSQLTNKTLDEYKKQIASTIKKAKDDIKLIPTRIDEVERNKPEYVDSSAVSSEIKTLENKISSIDNQLNDKAAAHDELIKKRNSNQEEIFKLRSKKNSIHFDITENAKRQLDSHTSKASEISSKIQKKNSDELVPAQNKLKKLTTEKETLIQNISSYESSITLKRNDWNLENAKTFIFSESNAVCPCCKRELDSEKTEETKKDLLSNFNANKKKILDEINAEGKNIAQKKKNAEEELKELESRISAGQNYINKVREEIDSLKIDLENTENESSGKPSLELVVEVMLNDDQEYKNVIAEIEKLEAIKFDIPEKELNQSLIQEKTELNSEIQKLRDLIRSNDLIKAADQRIEDLQKEELNLAQEIANIEKSQYIIDNFIKLKVDTIEAKINQKFSFVKFKLFDKQINGALVECCEALIGGVPFSDANTASKINAGIDIINTLCNFYNVSAPIFIDNRESVVKLQESNSQIINLFVSPEDKKIRIN